MSEKSIHELDRHYIYSGTLTAKMVELLQNIPDFKPFDCLVTQIDRSGVKTMLKFKEESGLISSFFLDSGAFSFHKSGIPADVDEYIEYANSLDEHTIAVAQLDHIPGKLGQPKTPKDYEESAKKSWENFLYMYPKMKSPEKLIPVYHQGESFDALRTMLEWQDDDGKKLAYIGVSPANDTAQVTKNMFMSKVYEIIAQSSNPNVKTHLFGMTSLDALAKFPYYSADSISHRLRSAYNKVFTRKWGTISLSDKSRTSKTKSNMSFLQTCDATTYKEFEELAASYNMTVEQLKSNNAYRVAFDMAEVQKALANEYAYRPGRLLRRGKLW